jgi:hypothetical protein
MDAGNVASSMATSLEKMASTSGVAQYSNATPRELAVA